MKTLADRHPGAVGVVLAILVINGLLVNDDRVLGPNPSEPLMWLGIVCGFLSIASVFGLLAHLITQAKKRKPPVNMEKWAEVRKTGKWKFAITRTLLVAPWLVVGFFGVAFITSGSASLSPGSIGTIVLLIAIFSAGLFFISAAIWDNEDAEFKSKEKQSAGEPKSKKTKSPAE